MSDLKPLSPLIDLTKGLTDTAFALNPDRKIEEFNRLFVKLHEVDREKIDVSHHYIGQAQLCMLPNETKQCWLIIWYPIDSSSTENLNFVF